MKLAEPIYVVELFPPLSRELLTVLKALQPAGWAQPTTCTSWSVKDVAAHLFGGNLGRLWGRDETSNSSESISGIMPSWLAKSIATTSYGFKQQNELAPKS